jgi:hypothetical protein
VVLRRIGHFQEETTLRKVKERRDLRGDADMQENISKQYDKFMNILLGSTKNMVTDCGLGEVQIGGSEKRAVLHILCEYRPRLSFASKARQDRAQRSRMT